ncbi:hypothetical protein G7046_g3942 [Stylonectria norvegica]|nr:hypothetical protein G7046_g3942 [Stylonectria norvegica]
MTASKPFAAGASFTYADPWPQAGRRTTGGHNNGGTTGSGDRLRGSVQKGTGKWGTCRFLREAVAVSMRYSHPFQGHVRRGLARALHWISCETEESTTVRIDWVDWSFVFVRQDDGDGDADAGERNDPWMHRGTLALSHSRFPPFPCLYDQQHRLQSPRRQTTTDKTKADAQAKQHSTHPSMCQSGLTSTRPPTAHLQAQWAIDRRTSAEKTDGPRRGGGRDQRQDSMEVPSHTVTTAGDLAANRGRFCPMELSCPGLSQCTMALPPRLESRTDWTVPCDRERARLRR